MIHHRIISTRGEFPNIDADAACWSLRLYIEHTVRPKQT
jgi:hypothetical protein